MLTTGITELLEAFDKAREEQQAAARQAEHWPYDHRTADELAADVGDIATQIVLAMQECGALDRGSGSLPPARMTLDHADVLLDAAARLDESIASDNDEPWTWDDHYPNPNLSDAGGYIAALAGARAVMRTLVSGDADSVVIVD